MPWIMLPLALLLVGIARIGIWLFPEDVSNREHYTGGFGQADQDTKSLGELTEKESNAIGAWWGYCEGDESK